MALDKFTANGDALFNNKGILKDSERPACFATDNELDNGKTQQSIP